MEVKTIKKSTKELEIELIDVNETVLNPITEILLQNKDVEYASYMTDHPESKSRRLIIKVKSGKPDELLKKVVKQLEDEVKDFIKGASVVILAFDQSRPDTFDNLKKYWEPLILEVLGDQVPVILVGNKIDLAEIISEDLVHQYIQHSKLNIKGYVKTSALQKKGLDVLFEKTKEAVYELIEQAKSSQ